MFMFLGSERKYTVFFIGNARIIYTKESKIVKNEHARICFKLMIEVLIFIEH
jgi:hypothetical protein